MSMTDYRLMGHHTDALRLTAELIKKRIWTKLTDFTVRANVTKEPLPFARRKEGKLRTFRLGDVWGDTFDCAWFFMSAVVPESAAGKVLYARVDVSGEALLVDGDGNPLKGFTSVTSGKTLTLGDFGKTIWPVNARPGEKVELTFDAGNNDLFGKNRGGRIIEAGLYACDTEMRALYYDYAVLFDLMCACDERYSWYHKIRRALTEAERRLDRFDADEVAACRRILAPLLSVRSAETGFELSVLGHAHLDLAWTWPVRETIRKGARTFATALAHMETYPDYIFGASQAQLYEWMRCNYPQLFERIRRRVEEGRWELQGGMWVECDLNIPCGEALVRQFLYGQAFFRQHFGRKAEVCWLPDSFGFTGALPQLIRGAGMSYFLTQKIRTAPHMIRYPHDTFLWKGIDGTAVLTHVAPYENYGSGGTPREIKACEERFLDKSVCDDALFLVGQGDGGGGAGAECLECYERTKDLEGLPRSRMRTAGDFFRRTDNRSLGVW